MTFTELGIETKKNRGEEENNSRFHFPLKLTWKIRKSNQQYLLFYSLELNGC